MTVKALIRAIDADPFKSFRMHLADGRSVRVTDPNRVAFFGNWRTLFVAHPRSEHFELIDLVLINSVIVGNGRGRSGRRKSA